MNEKEKIVKRYFSNATVLETERWLREEARLGWRLEHVKDGVFRNTYFFRKCDPSDEIIIAPVSFAKQPKYANTVSSVLAYLKVTYGGKHVSKNKFCLYIRLKRDKVTDIEDLKQNLIYREDCIKKDYLTWTLATAIPSAILCLVNLFGGNHWAIYLFVLFTGGFYSMISLIKLLHHQVICKREFEAFLKQ